MSVLNRIVVLHCVNSAIFSTIRSLLFSAGIQHGYEFEFETSKTISLCALLGHLDRVRNS